MNMEKFFTRLAALICTAGGAGLFWLFGLFLGQLLRRSAGAEIQGAEWQILAVSLVGGALTLFGSSRMLRLSENAEQGGRARGLALGLTLVAASAALVGGLRLV